MRKVLTAGLFLLLVGPGAFAQTLVGPVLPVPIALTISGNKAKGEIDLPGGIGADLTISFEQEVGLSPNALTVSAVLVDPLDPTLLSRLPGVLQVSVPSTFPVLLRISPSASSVLSFEGVYSTVLHTHNLQFNPAVPMSLFKAPDGGLFRDITTTEGRGSYRVDGGGGDFSEFLIGIDLRPIDSVIGDKFGALQGLLTNYAALLSPTVFNLLQSRLSQALTLYQSGATLGAITLIAEFSDDVKDHSGDEIPDVWRANDPYRVDVAGLLRSAADTLRFSLDRKTSGPGQCIP